MTIHPNSLFYLVVSNQKAVLSAPEEKSQGEPEAQTRVGEQNQETGDSYFDNRCRGTRTVLGDCSVAKDKGTSKGTDVLSLQ